MRKQRIYLISFLIIISCFVMNVGIIQGVNEVREQQRLKQYKIYEIYSYTKQQLYQEVDSYIKRYAPGSSLDAEYLVDKCIENDFDICFALGQGHLESHFGTAGKAKYTHSVWNVGSHKNHPYANANASVEPYIRLIKDKYVKDGKTELDLLYNFTTKNGGYRYATEGYEPKLRGYVNKIKRTTSIDSLASEVKKYNDILILSNDSIVALN